MKLLLDSHTLIWAVDEPRRLGLTATRVLQDPNNDLFLSAGAVWEIAIKIGLGKLVLTLPFAQWIGQAIADLGLGLLHITIDHAQTYTRLPMHHRDPFDRLFVAQVIAEGALLVSSDPAFDAYGINRLW